MDIDKTCTGNARQQETRTKKLLKIALTDSRYTQQVVLLVRDLEHFYEIVRWCNINAGYKKTDWTTVGKVLKYLRPSSKYYATSTEVIFKFSNNSLDLTPLTTL